MNIYVLTTLPIRQSGTAGEIKLQNRQDKVKNWRVFFKEIKNYITIVEDLENEENVMAKMIKEWKTIEKMGEGQKRKGYKDQWGRVQYWKNYWR